MSVYIRGRPQPPLPHYTIIPATAKPVQARFYTSTAEADIASNLTARGLPGLCWWKPPEIVSLGSNKDIWDVGAVGRTQGWYPEELNKSACYPEA